MLISSLPFHLIIPAIFSIAAFVIFMHLKKKFNSAYKKSLWLSLIVFNLCYGSILVKNIYGDYYYKWKVDQYDTNRNGNFEETELTKEVMFYRYRLISDTSRNFSFITGFIVSLVFSIFVYLTGLCIALFGSWGNNPLEHRY